MPKTKSDTNKGNSNSSVSEEGQIKEMLKKGVHFGHAKDAWHPNMEQYINGVDDGVHIIDLYKTKDMLEEASEFLSKSQKDNKKILWVGTLPTYNSYVKEFADQFDHPYVINRWIGGTLTNFGVISSRLEDFRELEDKVENEEEMKKYTHKEQVELERELEGMQKKWGGIKGMEEMPDVLVVLDSKNNDLALEEARKTDVTTVALVDTNMNPKGIDYPIPANDDAFSSISYILDYFKDKLEDA